MTTRLSKTQSVKLTAEYAEKIQPLLPLAKKAFGSRSTISPQHDASRQYTALLVSYYSKKGSLPDLAEALGVTYAGLRRRITQSEIPSVARKPRATLTSEQYGDIVARVMVAKQTGTREYHQQLKTEYDSGVSLNKLALHMGLASANPLYYGVRRVILREQQKNAAQG